jgi:hypothetical protein
MGGIGLDSWFNKLCFCNIILEAYSRQILEAALGIDVKA